MKRTAPLRIGFDLDGVLLYNPARIVRPIISWGKRMFLNKRKLGFYYPKTDVEKLMWKVFHLSSIYNAPGLDDIRQLVREKKIEAYLITARFSFLGNGVTRWVNKNGLDTVFTKVYFNAKDEQPHLFKERMMKELHLDMYIEDNFDIVNHLGKKTATKTLWIYNIFDRHVPHPHKFPNLKRAMRYVADKINNRFS